MPLADRLGPTLRGGLSGSRAEPVYELVGELDVSGSQSLVTRANEILGTTAGALVIDVGGLLFIDSSGLNALLRIRELALQRQRVIALRAVSGEVERLLQLTETLDVFQSEAPENPARQSGGQEAPEAS